MCKLPVSFVFIFFSLLLSTTGCKLFKVSTLTKKQPLPEYYSVVNDFELSVDTATVADVNWRDFLNDSLLVALIDTALIYNPDYNILFSKIEIAQAGFKFQHAELFPKVSAGIIGGVRKFGLYTMDGAGNISTQITPGKIVPIHLPDVNPGFITQWEIDLWGKLRNQRKSALANLLASREIQNLFKTNLIAEIATSYYYLQALDVELEVIKKTIQKQTEALEVIKYQKESARANELAVQQFQAQLLATQAMEREVLQLITLTENKINFLVGRFPQTVLRSQFYNDLPPPMLSIGLPAKLISMRPDIREAECRLKAAQCDVNAAKAAFFPNINLMATLGYQAFNFELLFSTPASLAYSVIASLIAPLINMNGLKAQLRKVKAEQQASLYEYQKRVLNGYTEVVNELSNLSQLKKNELLKKNQVAVLQDAVYTSGELYKAGKAGYLEVLLAQQNALMANVELVDVQLRKKNAIVNLYKALGGGWQ